MEEFKSMYAFEQYRSEQNIVPPQGSDTFYQIQPAGKIDLFTIQSSPGLQRFDISTEMGTVSLGETFVVSGSIYDTHRPYNNMFVKYGSTVEMNDSVLLVSRGQLNVYGTLDMKGRSVLTVQDDAVIQMDREATWNISEDSEINIISGKIYVFGKVTVPLSKARTLLKHPNIVWDTSAEIDVVGLEIADRPTTLRKSVQTICLLGFSIFSSHQAACGSGVVQVTCQRLEHNENYREVSVEILEGIVDLGDFRFSVLGELNRVEENTRVISSLSVNHGAMMCIYENREGHGYIFPELYIGSKENNCKKSGSCTVDGALMVQGQDAKVTIDRGGSLYIGSGGMMMVTGGAKIVAAYTTEGCINIDGQLVIDNMETLEGFKCGDIVIGKNGRLTILNKYPDENHILYSIPDGFDKTPLNQILGLQLDRVCYMIRANTGIEISTYYDYYYRDLHRWFGDYRIEDAVKRGIVCWEKGAFIKLSNSITWWATDSCDLTDLVKVFKYGSDEDAEGRLNDVVGSLTYAGFRDVRFLIDLGDRTRELTLSLEYPTLQNAKVDDSDQVQITTDKDGDGFLGKKIDRTDPSVIVGGQYKHFKFLGGSGPITTD